MFKDFTHKPIIGIGSHVAIQDLNTSFWNFLHQWLLSLLQYVGIRPFIIFKNGDKRITNTPYELLVVRRDFRKINMEIIGEKAYKRSMRNSK